MIRKLNAIILGIILCLSCFTFVGCNEKIESYNVNVNVWHANYGFAYGNGTFDENTNATITAVAKQGSKFMAWMKENVIVSYDAEYTFSVTDKTSGTYTAIFSCPDLELVTLKQIMFSDEYEEQNQFSELNIDFKVGGTYETLKDVYNTKIEDETTFEITDITLALNKKEKIASKITINYITEVFIDDEETTVTYTKETLIDINLGDLLETNELTIDIPSQIKGNATVKFVFEVFHIEEPVEE